MDPCDPGSVLVVVRGMAIVGEGKEHNDFDATPLESGDPGEHMFDV